MRRQRGLPEDLPTQGELDLAQPIREEPIVSHPLKATRQDMEELCGALTYVARMIQRSILP